MTIIIILIIINILVIYDLYYNFESRPIDYKEFVIPKKDLGLSEEASEQEVYERIASLRELFLKYEKHEPKDSP